MAFEVARGWKWVPGSPGQEGGATAPFASPSPRVRGGDGEGYLPLPGSCLRAYGWPAANTDSLVTAAKGDAGVYFWSSLRVGGNSQLPGTR